MNLRTRTLAAAAALTATALVAAGCASSSGGTDADSTEPIVFGVSGSNWPLYDMEHGKQAIGYEPQDYSQVPEEEWDK